MASESSPRLTLYNTLAREKQPFRPIDPARVRLYVCGPTVYDLAHIGNARPIIVFDVLFRLLRHLYGEAHVTYVRNVTDVDDKINARAAERGLSIRELTDGTLAQFHEDLRGLGVLPPTVEPRATDHIAEMHALIERLVAAGHAYVAENHVLFDVPSMPDYGRLSRRPLEEMEAGARVEVAPYKRSPLDFVLWKPSGSGDPAWPSPCGIAAPGRPGWHIECSAMAWKHLGETFDIHGGGIDLVFPHHENEVAQSCCAHRTAVMANVWMHNGFLQVEGEKMSKSLGNFVTIRDVLKDWPGEVVRLNMLRTHYRQPIDWTIRGLAEAQRIWSKWLSLDSIAPTSRLDRHFIDCLCDDLNTWEAIRRLEELSDQAQSGDEQAREAFVATARYFGFLHSPEATTFFFPGDGFNADPTDELVKLAQALPSSMSIRAVKDFLLSQDLTPANGFPDVIGLLSGASEKMSVWELKSVVSQVGNIQNTIRSRNVARAAKNWAESDRIRDELKAMGVAVKDNKDGTTSWEVAR